MAQTSGNRDEPSMEDILSSIRKIIQSNEDNTGAVSDNLGVAPKETQFSDAKVSVDAPAETVPQPQDPAEPKLVVKSVEKTFEQQASMQPSSGQQSPVQQGIISPPPPNTEASQIRVSRPADTSSSVGVGAQVQYDQGELTDAPARAPQAAAAAAARVPVQAAVQATAKVEAPEIVAKAPIAHEAPKQSLTEQVLASAQEVGAEQIAAALENELNAPKAEAAAAPKEAQRSVPALLSRDSGEKVAASFAELTQTLEEHANQNLEDMASDMLRPMLQEWLDDNLPSLVERLVREEIERVARGG